MNNVTKPSSLPGNRTTNKTTTDKLNESPAQNLIDKAIVDADLEFSIDEYVTNTNVRVCAVCSAIS